MSVGSRSVTDSSIARLDPGDCEVLAEVAGKLAAAEPGLIDEASWVAAARRAWHSAPAAMRGVLAEFRRDSGPQGALLLRGLPIDEENVPATPLVEGSVQRTTTAAAAILMLAACGLGDPVAFRAEKTGALVQDVVPVPGKEQFQGNAGSVLLEWHNENAFHIYRPDYVMLLCLRADHDGIAGLRTACVRQALPLLSDQGRAALSAPEFATQPPPSFGAVAGGGEPHAVLTGAWEDPDLKVDLAATTGLTPRAEGALVELQEVFATVGRTLVLSPGDLAIVDNRVTVHGRTAFQPRYDGRDRWLQRTFVLRDLRRSRDQRPGDGYVID
ncbi:TauD/TfdA family dioxygenase [Kutzneria sp. NPDC051319]|uniref:TauD/TfdA family dioxygenase n=1 Tax=Kutzneria sp. NPDC051319 TaxID=3155047 RepID=UPI003418D50D